MINTLIAQFKQLHLPSGLRQRLFTGLLLSGAVSLAVLWLPTAVLALVMSSFMLLGAWEWIALAGWTHPVVRMLYVGLLALVLAGEWFLLTPNSTVALIFVAAVALWWLALVVLLPQIRTIVPATRRELGLALLGLGLLSAPWFALARLHSQPQSGPWLVLFLLTLVWLADSAAYFAGRRWGQHKLAPVLSPGKTLEGLWGALAIGGLWGILLAWTTASGLVVGSLMLVLCLITVVISVVGDLYESWLKRRRDVKDAGALLPGHGGMLDRIDSLIAATPVFVLGFYWLGAGA